MASKGQRGGRHEGGNETGEGPCDQSVPDDQGDNVPFDQEMPLEGFKPFDILNGSMRSIRVVPEAQ